MQLPKLLITSMWVISTIGHVSISAAGFLQQQHPAADAGTSKLCRPGTPYSGAYIRHLVIEQVISESRLIEYILNY